MQNFWAIVAFYYEHRGISTFFTFQKRVTFKTCTTKTCTPCCQIFENNESWVLQPFSCSN